MEGGNFEGNPVKRAQHLSALMTTGMQLDICADAKAEMFQYTNVCGRKPYYYCLTGLPRKVYHDRLGIGGTFYADVYFNWIHPCVLALMNELGFCGTPYLIYDNAKRIGLIFQPKDAARVSPVDFAGRLSRAIQGIYCQYLPAGTGPYHNTAALSGAVEGINGVYQGHSMALALAEMAFFDSQAELFTKESIRGCMNRADYHAVMTLCRKIARHVAAGEYGACRADIDSLFLSLLKNSYSFGLVQDTLSYLKHFLTIRLTVYSQAPAVDPERAYSCDCYLSIEECYNKIDGILEELSRVIRHAGPCSDTIASSAYYIRQHLDTDISLCDIADYAGISQSHLSSSFHKQMGMTIKQYQAVARIDYAAELLEHTEHRISDIAAMAGFSSRKYFSATFKSMKGITPKGYRLRSRGTGAKLQ